METMEIARVTAKGQITIPISIRQTLGLRDGSKVLFVGEGEDIRMVNASVQALHNVQRAFKGEARRLSLKNEDDVMTMIKQVRAEIARENAHNT